METIHIEELIDSTAQNVLMKRLKKSMNANPIYQTGLIMEKAELLGIEKLLHIRIKL